MQRDHAPPAPVLFPFRFKVPAFAETRPVKVLVPPSVRMPALKVVVPSQVLLPLSTRVPAPALVMLKVLAPSVMPPPSVRVLPETVTCAFATSVTADVPRFRLCVPPV